MAICKSGSPHQKINWPAQIYTHIRFKPLSLWYFVMTAWAEQDICFLYNTSDLCSERSQRADKPSRPTLTQATFLPVMYLLSTQMEPTLLFLILHFSLATSKIFFKWEFCFSNFNWISDFCLFFHLGFAFFFFFGLTAWHVESYFPDQGWNPCPWRGSWSLNH